MNIPKKLNEIGTALTMLKTTSSVTAKELYNALAPLSKNRIALITTALKDVNASGASKGMKELGLAISGLSRETQIAILSSQKLTETQMKQALASAGLAKEQISQTLATQSLKVAQDATTLSTWSATAAWQALKAAIASNPIGIALTAITTVVSIAIPIFQNLSKAQQEVINKAKEIEDAYKSTTAELSSNLETLIEVEESFKKLSKGVSDYGANVSLSTEEYSRYNDIIQQVLNITPQLITGYGTEGRAIANKNELIERSIELLKEEQREKLRSITSDENTKTLANGSMGVYNVALNKIEQSQWEAINAIDDITRSIFSESMKDVSVQDVGRAIASFRRELMNTVGDIDSFYAEFEKVKIELAKLGASDDDITRLHEWAKDYELFVKNFNSASKDFNKHLPNFALLADGYDDLSDAQKDFITRYINGFKITVDTTEKDLSAMGASVLSFVESLASNDVAKAAIDELFTIDKNRPLAEVEELTNNLIRVISNALGESEETIRLRLGITIDSDALKTNLKEAQPEIKQTFDEIASEFQEEEIKFIINTDADWTANSIEELRQKFDELRSSSEEAARDTEFKNLLDDTRDKVNLLRDAMTEQANTGSISADTYAAIFNRGEDYQGLLDETADGLIVLTDETGDYINSLIGAAIQTAVLNGYTKEQISSLSDLYVKTANINDLLDNAQSEIGGLNKAIQSLNEGNDLLVDDMFDLIQEYPELAKHIEATTDGYTIEIGVLEDLRQQKIAEYETAIKSEIEKTKQTLESSKARLSMYKIEISAIKDLATAQAEVAKLGGEKHLPDGLDGLVFDDVNQTINGITPTNYETQKKILREQQQLKESITLYGQLQENLDLALSALNNTGLGNSSSSSSEKSSSSSSKDAHLEKYKALVKEIDYFRKMDMISEEEYYNRLEALANEYLKGREKYLDDYRSAEVEIYNGRKKLLEDAIKDAEKAYEAEKKAAEEAYKARKKAAEDAYKAEKKAAEDAYKAQKKALQAQKDALKDQLDAYKKLIDYKKQLLQQESDAHDFDNEVAESNKKIAELQAQIDALSLDDSAKANAKRLELQEELNKERANLEEKQYDHSIDVQSQALDNEYNRYKNHLDSQIKLLEDQIDALGDSHDRALEQMESTHEATLLSMETAHEATLLSMETASQALIDSIKLSFNALVNEAQTAANQIAAAFEFAYAKGQSYSNVVSAQQQLVDNGYNVGSTGVDGIWGKNTEKAFTEAWQQYLNSLGANLVIDGIRGSKTKSAEQQFGVVFPTYHTGGVVGSDVDTGTKKKIIQLLDLKPDEIVAKLQDGETVLTSQQMANLTGGLSEVSKAAFDPEKLAIIRNWQSPTNHLSAMTDHMRESARSTVFKETNNIKVEVYNEFHNVDPSNASNLKKLSNEITERVVEAVSDQFVKHQQLKGTLRVRSAF